MKHRPHVPIKDLTGRPAPRRQTNKPRIVPCPECKAQVGEPCVSANGKLIGGGHQSRQRMAARALAAQREAAANGTQEA